MNEEFQDMFFAHVRTGFIRADTRGFWATRAAIEFLTNANIEVDPTGRVDSCSLAPHLGLETTDGVIAVARAYIPRQERDNGI